jgi:hypothetical protein
LFASRREYVGGIKRCVSAAVLDDVGPDLEDPQTAHEGLIDGSASELGQVVRIAAKRRAATVAGKLFGAGFWLGDNRQHGQLEVVGAMDREGHEREELGFQDEWAASELDGRTESRLTEFGMVNRQSPMTPVAPCRREGEPKAPDRGSVDGCADPQDRVLARACKIEVGRESSRAAEATLAP